MSAKDVDKQDTTALRNSDPTHRRDSARASEACNVRLVTEGRCCLSLLVSPFPCSGKLTMEEKCSSWFLFLFHSARVGRGQVPDSLWESDTSSSKVGGDSGYSGYAARTGLGSK
jgi:hypothetical protein